MFIRGCCRLKQLVFYAWEAERQKVVYLACRLPIIIDKVRRTPTDRYCMLKKTPPSPSAYPEALAYEAISRHNYLSRPCLSLQDSLSLLQLCWQRRTTLLASLPPHYPYLPSDWFLE